MPRDQLQPLLHSFVTCVSAPQTVLSGADGQIRQTGAHGLFSGDVRVLSLARLTVDGQEPECLNHDLDGPRSARFVAAVRGVVDRGHDPALLLTRVRRAASDGMSESIELTNDAFSDARVEVRLELASDMTPMDKVKRGDPTEVAPPQLVADTLRWSGPDTEISAVVTADGATLSTRPAQARWEVVVPAGGSVHLAWSLVVTDAGSVVAPAPPEAPWRRPSVHTSGRRLDRLVGRSLADLDALRLCTRDQPGSQFFAAGSPWFLTLFGRDSLWSARMTLGLGTAMAEGTLDVLAARQGTAVDGATASAPGKILHEVRRAPLLASSPGQERVTLLPPLYYGTIDATPLWVLLLHDAWRFGMPPAHVERLLPVLERAMGWVTGPADSDGDGFLEYVDTSGHGLANQGWKDSGDSVRFRDGRIAEAPIALSEVQGYAHEAALAAAALLDAFGRPGGDRLRGWAAVLNDRFRSAFWLEDDLGAYPALALDGAKRPVDARASNMGHLFGTGLLDPAESEAVARRLGQPDMLGSFGMRTMSSDDEGFAPLSYHCGSIWPHDTAIVANGAMREGHPALAARLVAGLVDASESFEGRLPELYGGRTAGATAAGPTPYPAACRPQAWAAAAGISAVTTLLGLEADVPEGVVRLRPTWRTGDGPITVRGLTVGGAALHVELDADGTVSSVRSDRDDLRIEVEQRDLTSAG